MTPFYGRYTITVRFEMIVHAVNCSLPHEELQKQRRQRTHGQTKERRVRPTEAFRRTSGGGREREETQEVAEGDSRDEAGRSVGC